MVLRGDGISMSVSYLVVTYTHTNTYVNTHVYMYISSVFCSLKEIFLIQFIVLSVMLMKKSLKDNQDTRR